MRIRMVMLYFLILVMQYSRFLARPSLRPGEGQELHPFIGHAVGSEFFAGFPTEWDDRNSYTSRGQGGSQLIGTGSSNQRPEKRLKKNPEFCADDALLSSSHLAREVEASTLDELGGGAYKLGDFPAPEATFTSHTSLLPIPSSRKISEAFPLSPFPPSTLSLAGVVETFEEEMLRPHPNLDLFYDYVQPSLLHSFPPLEGRPSDCHGVDYFHSIPILESGNSPNQDFIETNTLEQNSVFPNSHPQLGPAGMAPAGVVPALSAMTPAPTGMNPDGLAPAPTGMDYHYRNPEFLHSSDPETESSLEPKQH
ncbi:hypothetical protein PGTUg99_005980 [Puccinia graminis f. sp. tritici]|uniref:Uncharacterized protein n=1 Tax=Puccinia graminis f. sp. tritici TaxID=56615 RepID=A0A5B0NVE1_PUCGR|nr:hypothetical protein PGTUg99_005980 [Puccinia graminis f. sp. tritici]